jgi:hypothetical protein
MAKPLLISCEGMKLSPVPRVASVPSSSRRLQDQSNKLLSQELKKIAPRPVEALQEVRCGVLLSGTYLVIKRTSPAASLADSQVPDGRVRIQ